jgi:hypothetical protein
MDGWLIDRWVNIRWYTVGSEGWDGWLFDGWVSYLMGWDTKLLA